MMAKEMHRKHKECGDERSRKWRCIRPGKKVYNEALIEGSPLRREEEVCVFAIEVVVETVGRADVAVIYGLSATCCATATTVTTIGCRSSSLARTRYTTLPG